MPRAYPPNAGDLPARIGGRIGGGPAEDRRNAEVPLAAPGPDDGCELADTHATSATPRRTAEAAGLASYGCERSEFCVHCPVASGASLPAQQGSSNGLGPHADAGSDEVAVHVDGRLLSPFEASGERVALAAGSSSGVMNDSRIDRAPGVAGGAVRHGGHDDPGERSHAPRVGWLRHTAGPVRPVGLTPRHE